MPKASQETETATKNGTVSSSSPFQRLRRRMADMAALETAGSRVTGEDVNRILSAENEEEMWDADELNVYNASKLSGCDLQLISFDVRYGDSSAEIDNPIFVDEKGRDMYLLVYAFRITNATEKRDVVLPPIGEVFTFNTSARNIVAKLYWMLDNGWFDPKSEHGPVRVHIKGTPLSGGRSVEKLKQFTGTPLVQAAIEEPSF